MRSVVFKNRPVIISAASVGGPKEVSGNIGKFLDVKLKDDLFGEKTFEKAETKMQYTAISEAIKKSGKNTDDFSAIISGDLLNQVIASSFAARDFDVGFLGAYSACSTFTEAIFLSAVMIDGGYINNAVCATSSHFSSAERQYRYPLELGCTRPPQSQWTVTGAGACVVSNGGEGVKISGATIGKIIDFGVTDANNMGAAMAPAAADTIVTCFKETSSAPEDFDLILTGDLGALGSRLVKELVWEKGFDMEKQHVDCGEIIFNIDEKEYQGGSGAGCSSIVFSSYIYPKMCKKQFKRVLFVATGALLSSLSSQQGESIPGVAHAVILES